MQIERWYEQGVICILFFFKKIVAVFLCGGYNSFILLLQDIEIIQAGISICRFVLFFLNGRMHVSCGVLIFLILVRGMFFIWRENGRQREIF